MFRLVLLFMCCSSSIFASQIVHRELIPEELQGLFFIWEEQNLAPFDELLVSWDAARPKQGHYLISVSLFSSEWSPWFDYAFWGASDQYTFSSSSAPYKIFQDTIELIDGQKATAFRMRVVAMDGAHAKEVRALHACATDLKHQKVSLLVNESLASILLPVPGLSQAALAHERRMHLCSPTSLTAVINYLSPYTGLSAVSFAETVHDSAFDIYGNWVLNTAQASHVLGRPWHCYVGRFTSLKELHEQLSLGYPVVVSIRGPLTGSALPYSSGHLIVVKGYDALTKKVVCMDPAFPDDRSTHVCYDAEDFLEAWSRRGGVAYMFYQVPR